MASKSNFSEKVRTRRLKVSIEKASENHFMVKPGFELDLSEYLHLMPTDNNELSYSGFKGFQLAEGFQRAAILVATVRPPTLSNQHDEQS